MALPVTSRRAFVKTALVAAPLVVPSTVFAAGSDAIRVGLIGCGGRGTGAAVQVLQGSPNVILTAMGDAFGDRLKTSLTSLRKQQPERVKVDADHCFTGLDAYKQVIDSDVDVVLLCGPPGFRPMQIEYAVQKGRHIFAEKPMATDAAGVRSLIKSVAEARSKKLALVAGFNSRYSKPARALMGRIHDGAIGQIKAMYTTFNTGYLWNHGRKPEWSDMEWQIRNWYYFTWLSGDHLVEQAVHNVDKMIWAMKDRPPARALALGGRQVRTEPMWGHIYDHFAVLYEWDDGTRGFLFCRQQENCANDVSDHFMGTRGNADNARQAHAISGENPWKYDGEVNSGHQTEQEELIASIRKGQPIDQGDRYIDSTLAAIMGRMAAYTGQVVTWEQAMNSRENLMPGSLAFGPTPTPPVAMPGRTKLV